MMKFALVVLALVAGTSVHAEKCVEALKPHEYLVAKNIHTRVAFLSIVDRENYKQMSSGGSLAAQIKAFGIPFGGEANYEQFSEGRDKYFQQVGLQSSFDDASNYLLSAVPPEAFKAYSQCLTVQAAATHGLHIIPQEASEKSVTVTVFWNPPPSFFSWLDAKPRYQSIGFEGESIKNLPRSLQTNSKSQAILSLTPGSENRLVANADGYSASFRIPAPPKVIDPPAASRPARVVLWEYKTEPDDSRMYSMLFCPDDYTIVEGSVDCVSTSPAQSGTPTKIILDKTGVACKWPQFAPRGVGHTTTAVCRLTP